LNCNICQSKIEFIFKAKVLRKYNVSYFRCTYCGFIQTEKPFWIKEAYKNPIGSLDLGLVRRNLHISRLVEKLIKKNFNRNEKFLDFAGGYGLLVRLMRDKGFDFFRYDKYCENIFAKYFDLNDLPPQTKFELMLAIEIFEHFEKPLSNIAELFELSDSILFSTKLLDTKKPEDFKRWEYFAFEEGQHISFYTRKCLEIIASRFKCNFYTDNKGFHLLTSEKMPNKVLRRTISNRILKKTLKIIRSLKNGNHAESFRKNDIDIVKKSFK